MGGGWTIEFTKPCNKRGEGLYPPQILLQLELLHEQCGDIIAPGTLFHLGGKTLQVCATNSTHGGTHNTSPFWHRVAEPRQVLRFYSPGLEPSARQCLSLDSRSNVRLAAFHERTPTLENASAEVHHGGVRSERRLGLSASRADAEFLRNLFIFFTMLYGAMSPVVVFLKHV